MSVQETHLTRLRSEFPAVAVTRLVDGSAAVKIPELRLPTGKWTSDKTSVYFVIPVGYPMARPDCFWTEWSLRLAGGGMPKNTGGQVPPFSQEQLLWFSWHLSSWNPNRDDLVTYINTIKTRLDRAE
jgi:Prokaryotic E2 family E